MIILLYVGTFEQSCDPLADILILIPLARSQEENVKMVRNDYCILQLVSLPQISSDAHKQENSRPVLKDTASKRAGQLGGLVLVWKHYVLLSHPFCQPPTAGWAKQSDEVPPLTCSQQREHACRQRDRSETF